MRHNIKNCKLVKIDRLSGNRASIYSIAINGENDTLLDKFVNDNLNSFKSETKDILMRLTTIGKSTGARTQFFKENEGSPGDGVCALFDDPDSNLRLYCIKYGSQLIIVGYGGPKSKDIREFQQDPVLTSSNYDLRWLSSQITERIKSKEIRYINNGFDFDGDLEFNEDIIE